ncbi:hypothetical protein QQ045_000951 [Rhodiola kirilowii]
MQRLKRQNGPEAELIGLGAVRSTRGLGRKRVRISKEVKAESCCCESSLTFLLLKACLRICWVLTFGDFCFASQIRVLCGVGHGDLKQLMLGSKSVMKAALVAKKLHFAYSTPTKVKAFRNNMDMKDSDVEIEAPAAPRQSRISRRKISLKTKEDLAVSLFQQSDEAENWFRRGLRILN